MEHKIELLLEKYLDKNCSNEEEQLLDEWYDSLGADEDIQFTDAELKEVKEKIWRSISAKTIGVERTTSTGVIPF